MKSRVIRISEELVKEIENVQRKNNIKFIDASREIAKIVINNKPKEVIRKIRF